ncbi:MAG: lytic transglycosylase domain-containing protein [Deltaproteobacteria bacterium]|nr:lytic transglycosylase domain-containing protein [Deltaproteobacteria bacterium]
MFGLFGSFLVILLLTGVSPVSLMAPCHHPGASSGELAGPFGTGAFHPPWRQPFPVHTSAEEILFLNPVPIFPANQTDGRLSAELPVVSYLPGELKTFIKRSAKKNGLDERLVQAVIQMESGFESKAVSSRGAMGLMQLMPDTAKSVGVINPFDAKQNIVGGVKYLKFCLDNFDQDVGLALAAYNAGPGNVTKYKGCPPFKETQKFVATIMKKVFGHDWRKETKITFASNP